MRAVTRIILSLLLFVFVSATVLLLLPPTQGLGQKACLAAALADSKAYTLTHPLPEAQVPDMGNEGYTGSGAGAERIPVLMYHYIVPEAANLEPNNRSMITLEAFERGMNFLHEEGYYTATLSELEDYVYGNIRLPEKTVVITFDDGYENNYIYAYPILRDYGFRAAVFLVGENVQEETTEAFHPNRNTYFSREQIALSADVFEFHSHTYRLHYKKKDRCGKDYAATRDIELLKADIEQMKGVGIDSPYVAYPYGDFNYRMIYQLRQHGYRMAFTVAQGFVKPGDRPMYLKRLTVASDTDLSALLVGNP